MPPAAQVYAENKLLCAELAELKLELGRLRAQIEYYKRKLFGGGQSEKLDRAQMLLALGELETTAQKARELETITYRREKNDAQTKRERDREAFEKLPVTESIVIEPEEVKADPAAYEKISEERTVELDITPPKLIKREYIRPKYRRRDKRAQPPVVAPAPARPVSGGYASAGLLAYIINAKYCDHLPLRRLERMSAHWGLQIPAQNMVEWMRIAAEWLQPIYNKMRENLLTSGYLQADETPVRCNDPTQRRNGTKQTYIWVMGTPGGDVVFEHKPSRAHEHAGALLGKDYRGILQSDAYGCYQSYAREHEEVTALGCFAHTRRKFFEAQKENTKLARVILKLIGRLYRYEREWNERKVGHDHVRVHMRTKHYARTLRWLRAIALKQRDKVLPKSQMGGAITYLLNQWDSLAAHASHGYTLLDTNLIENDIRPSAVGKRNWLFIGHPEAGQRSAILYSIVISCRRHGKEPLAYLRDVLARLPAMSNQDDLTPLLPANWQPPRSKQPAQIDANGDH
jgi:transposase